jgi:hypothetical protein
MELQQEYRPIDACLRAWKQNADRMQKFFAGLTEEQMQAEVAPGKNRMIYLWGHLVAVHDGLLPLLGIGPRLYPELEATFITSPDRTIAEIPSAAEINQASERVNEALWSAFTAWSVDDWLSRHTNVSEEDFKLDPHRNRLAILLSRTSHIAYHLGQAVLTRAKA